ncbi:MAG: carboxypeptidase-like regulatory domain-containing protein [Cyclobacteriaceae bacterium]
MKGLIAILSFLVVLGFANVACAQNQRRVIQLSGVVSDSVQVLPGVHIYVPKAGRGTTTNTSGFFSMPVLVGDSVVISSVGYHRTHYIVPDVPKELFTILVELTPDITFLKDVVIMALPTEELFKEAVLAMNIPLDNGLDRKALNAEMIALMARTTPLDGAGNYKYYIDQWSNSAGDKFRPIYNPFLDPIKWAKFIKSLKKKK